MSVSPLTKIPMAVDADATVVIPVGPLALGPIPSARFFVFILEGRAGSPARVKKMVVVEHPVGAGVVKTGMFVVLTWRLEHPPLPVMDVTIDLVLSNILLLLEGNVNCVVSDCRVFFLDGTSVDPDGGV